MRELDQAQQALLNGWIDSDDLLTAFVHLYHWARQVNTQSETAYERWRKETDAGDPFDWIEFLEASHAGRARYASFSVLTKLDHEVGDLVEGLGLSAQGGFGELKPLCVEGPRPSLVRCYWIVRFPHQGRSRRPTAAQREHNSVHFLSHHRLFPSLVENVDGRQIRLRVVAASHATEQKLDQALQRPNAFAQLHRFDDLSHVKLLELNPPSIAARRLAVETCVQSERARVVSEVCTVFERSEGAAFLLLPECTLARDWARHCASKLSQVSNPPALSIFGSAHEFDARSNAWRNVTEVFDHRGTRLFEHVKTSLAVMQGMQEGIAIGDTMTVLVGRFGVIGVALCNEFFSPLFHSAMWDSIGPDWMLIPTMGEQSTLDEHLRMATQLANRHRAKTLICLQRQQSPPSDLDRSAVLPNPHYDPKSVSGSPASQKVLQNPANHQGRVDLNSYLTPKLANLSIFK